VAADFKAPRGTFDVLPDAAAGYARFEQTARSLLERAGYGRIETPAFEETQLFERGVGGSTDIVRKEMFTFEDKGGRSLTLRPEGTAPICRAYVEHGMHKLAQPVKLWHLGPYFRHERPQAGRYREFNQLGTEAIGTDSPLADAELIVLLTDLLGELGVPGVSLRLGSLGSLETRRDYLEELRAYLREHEGDLSKDVADRIDANPLRAFDADDEGTREVMRAAPQLLDRLEAADAEHFTAVRELLDAAGAEYEVDGTLVRGLDYYTRTIFEVHCDRLGAQSQVGGGGRYDGLVAQLGGPPTAAVGFAVGVERVLLALDAEPPEPSTDVFVALADGAEPRRAMALLGELRNSGRSAEADLGGRGLKGQLKHADRIGARHAVILEADGAAQLRDMESGEQREVEAGRILEEL
jgi:histidyl-tRNA synthetase